MICPKCGQEVIDPKEFCLSCGYKLKETKKVSKKAFIFLIIGMLLFGALICYTIINYNADKELNKYINEKV
jgi:uncharacterized protein with PQ loop repeat